MHFTRLIDHPSSFLPVRRDGGVAFVTVVLPVRNEEAHIEQILRMLLQQDYPLESFEVLVVDGMSSDATREIVNRYTQASYPVKLLDNPRLWASAGRNVGVHHARGDIVVIVDGHCELRDRRYLKHLVEVFERTGADVVGRPQPLTRSRNSAVQQAIALARSSPLGHHPDSYIYSAEDQFVPAQSVGAAYRRNVFEQLGEFDESFDACEDVEFNYRADQAGLPCYLSTQATVHYHPRGSLGALFHQLARYGRGRVRLYRKHSETFTLKSMAPGFFLIGLLLGGLLACFHPFLLTAYLLLVGCYLLTLFLFSVRIAWQSGGWLLLPWLPLVFLAIHLGAGWGILQEWLWGNRHST